MTNDELLELKALAEKAEPFKETVWSSGPELEARKATNWELFIQAKEAIPGLVDEIIKLRNDIGGWIATAEELNMGRAHVDELLAVRDEMAAGGGISEKELFDACNS